MASLGVIGSDQFTTGARAAHLWSGVASVGGGLRRPVDNGVDIREPSYTHLTMDPFTISAWAFDKAHGLQQNHRHVRVLVHRAVFLTVPTSAEHFFVKVTNLSAKREVEITHIWFTTKPVVHVLNPERPLPARLRLDEQFETWWPVASVPGAPGVERLVRVQLSNGKVLKSRLNKTVPPAGYVAGGGSR